MPQQSKRTAAVIGAGVVGTAVARLLARAGCETLILEKGLRPFEGITSRNSGVIHAGLYYPPGSLKARLCIEGRRLLYTWCREKGIPHKKTGKLIVASSPDRIEALDGILTNARACGAVEVQRLSRSEIKRRAPDIEAVAALWSPETGVVDPVELAASFLRDAEASGAQLITDAEVQGAEVHTDSFTLRTRRGPMDADFVVNSAGLYADEVAASAGVAKYKIHPWRGDYFAFRPGRTFRHQVYPAKRRTDPGLGVHLTMDLQGRIRLGPDAEAVTSKEDFSPREEKLESFLEAARQWFPWAERKMLSYDTCGIRPKLRGPGEADEKDFVIARDLPGWIDLVGIESPGLTACMAIAESVLKMARLS